MIEKEKIIEKTRRIADILNSDTPDFSEAKKLALELVHDFEEEEKIIEKAQRIADILDSGTTDFSEAVELALELESHPRVFLQPVDGWGRMSPGHWPTDLERAELLNDRQRLREWLRLLPDCYRPKCNI